MLVTNWIVQASNITSGKKMAAVSIHKWTVRFFLVFLIYPSANARGGHLDWIELADEIVHQQWCGTTDYCGFRNQSDDPATTESSTNEGLRKMTVQKPNDMKENQSVYICLSFYAFHDRCLTKHFHYKHWKKKIQIDFWTRHAIAMRNVIVMAIVVTTRCWPTSTRRSRITSQKKSSSKIHWLVYLSGSKITTTSSTKR